jgi:hypothetical protein
MRIVSAVLLGFCALTLCSCDSAEQAPTELSAAPKQVLSKAQDVDKVIDAQDEALRQAIEQQEQ